MELHSKEGGMRTNFVPVPHPLNHDGRGSGKRNRKLPGELRPT
jgi:hypothetical protein